MSNKSYMYVYVLFFMLKVATSGYEPWKDCPVKGWWLDNLPGDAPSWS